MKRGHCRGTKRERPGNDWWRRAYLAEVERVEKEWKTKAQTITHDSMPQRSAGNTAWGGDASTHRTVGKARPSEASTRSITQHPRQREA